MSSPSAAGPADTATELVAALEEARARTLALVAPFSDAELERVHSTLMSPLAWDLGHIAAFEDLWLVHRYGDRPLLRADLVEVYDAMETPRAKRGDLPFLAAAEAREYLDEVRARTLDVLDERGIGDGVLHELVLRHEQQHNETMVQTLQLARLDPGSSFPRLATDADGDPPPAGLELVEVPGGECAIGAPPPSLSFAYDNERPRHLTDVREFRIGRHPITNASYLHFVEGGGYERREWWSDEGWAWKEQYDITRPGGWTPDHGGEWQLGQLTPLDPRRPVVHVSWFEAEAFARAHELRLPTETEWEKAATWDQAAQMARRYPWGNESPVPGVHANVDLAQIGPAPAAAHPAGASPTGALGMIGDVWEWTASEFSAYPGFTAYPYREYSEPFFDTGYRVLRGGSWATRTRVATPTFRNWDYPQRRQIFSGFRVAE
jgi:iron(II)-dependent oxidoreductase